MDKALLPDLDALTRGVVQVVAGKSRGSGFVIAEPDLVATNQHVVDGGGGAPIHVILHDGSRRTTTIVANSPADEDDFCLLRLNNPAPADVTPLKADTTEVVIGSPVTFIGYPHGIPDLLVQRAHVAGFSSQGFYIDGSVNGGNSGGPAISTETGKVIGIVTARRFLGQTDLEAAAERAAELQRQADTFANPQPGIQITPGLSIGGVDFVALQQSVSEQAALLHQLLLHNANTGIGIVYEINHAMNAYKRLLKGA